MNTLLADPPASKSPEQPAAGGPPSVSPEGGPEAASPGQAPKQEHVCAHCGAPLREGQQWCLNCGACEPGSLGERANWRPLTVLALAATVLVAAAAVATAAALNKHSAPSHPVTVALAPTVPAATTPATTTPALPATPGTTSTPGAGGVTGTHTSSGKGSANNLLFPPSSASRPPKVPAPTATPKSTGGSAGESTGSSGKSKTSSTPETSKTTETGTSTTEAKTNAESNKSEPPAPILLDTNSATTYNPYSYPEAGFGDPALAIDGEPSTAWTAQVQAQSFPSMAEGLLIDLRSSTKLGSAEIRTSTRGMTIQVYGANGPKAPATITDPGWTPLSSSHVLKKTVTHLKLRTENQAFRWLVVWIVKAPPASKGTPQAPGQVALNEVALFPPASS